MKSKDRSGAKMEPNLATMQSLLRTLASTLEAVARRRETNRLQLAESVRLAHAQLGEVLGQLEAKEVEQPALPQPDSEGHYPALETVQGLLARQIIERRLKAGLTPSELAKRAGIREETLLRLESGKHPTTVRTVEKVEKALTAAGV